MITDEDPTAFRLHRGVLARHSEVFSDMLKLPQPMEEPETYEGCQVVSIYDSPVAVSVLFKALYDGPKFANSCRNDFFDVASVLRLSTKYFIAHLRRQAIDFLAQTWGVTLEGHDMMLETALSAPQVDDFTYPYVHPLHLLNLARETNAPLLVPSAFYFLSLYTLSDVLKADHPKLLVDHVSKPSSQISTTDILYYSLVYQQRLQYMETFLHSFCTVQAAHPICNEPQACSKGFARLLSSWHRSWNLRTGVLHFIQQAIRKVQNDRTLCSLCRSNFAREASTFRQTIWNELPHIVNLSSWEQLQAS